MIPVIALMVLTSLGCNRNKEPPPPSGVPPLTGTAQSPQAPPQNAPGGSAAPGLPQGHPPVTADNPPSAGGGAEGGRFEGQMPGGAFDPKKTLHGTIDISPHLKSKVTPGETVYLSVRMDDGSERGGTILAVKKLAADKWPIMFELDGRDAMFEGTTFAGKVVFWAHIDRDGDPITRGPGDLIGELRTTIPSTIKMTIDKVL